MLRVPVFLVAALAASLLPAQASAQVPAQDWVTDQWDVMGTRATLTLWPPADGNAETLVDLVRDEFEHINRRFSPWLEESELSRLNRLGHREPVQVSDEFIELLEHARRYHALTDGAFDITFASVGRLYDYRAGQAPDSERLQQTSSGIGMEHVVWRKNHVRLSHPQTRLDFGGIAKGHAIDRAIMLLRDAGVEHAWLSLGGDSYVLGDRRGRLWQVGIRHPRNPEGTALTLPAEDIAISTSGDYERFFIDEDGNRVHHILDPGSGRPAGELVSVTVMTQRGVDADALSTGLFVMGIERGMALANTLEDVSVIMIGKDGEVRYSDDLLSSD